MHKPLEATQRSTPVRRKQRGTHDRATVSTILDEALVCHVGFLFEGAPIVLPTAYVRIGDEVFMHGSPANRMFNQLASGIEACVTVTLVDGLVLGKTAMHHSMNYRSVTLFGRGRRVSDRSELEAAFRAIVDAALPGRAAQAHSAADGDYKATTVIAFPIHEGAAKVRAEPPLEEDVQAIGYCGVIPLLTRPERAIAAPDSATPVPHVSALARVRDFGAFRAMLQRAFGWDGAADAIIRWRLERYRRAQPDGWFELLAQRDAASEPEIAGGGGCMVFSDVAYFGLVGVDPAFQRRGLGRIIMDRLVRFANARGATTFLLDASDKGAPLYAQMGWITLAETRSYKGGAARGPSPGVRPATDRELVFALDREAYGGDRSALLEEGRALVHDDGGFCIAFDTTIGPIVARTPDIAAELLDAALALPFARAPEILSRSPAMFALLDARGFTHVRSWKHMALAPRDPRPMIFAQMSLATG